MQLDDIAIIEGNTETDERTYFEAVQRAINGGEAWKFQGSYGRTMMAAIDSGHCLLGLSSFSDFYGSHIPSRIEVASGSKGSREYVVRLQGEEWAATMESIGDD
jgi:hypothetical protein